MVLGMSVVKNDRLFGGIASVAFDPTEYDKLMRAWADALDEPDQPMETLSRRSDFLDMLKGPESSPEAAEIYAGGIEPVDTLLTMDPPRHKIYRSLINKVFSAGRVDKLSLPGLKDERRGILAAGVAILAAVFDSLGLEHMDVTAGALREGVLYDQLGRIRHEDVRDAR